MPDHSNIIERRAYIIGAGMSAECGAPIIKKILDPPFTNFVKEKKLGSLLQFISKAYPKGAQPTIEEVFSLVDHAIVRGDSLAGYDNYNLQKIRETLILVLSEILTGIQDKHLQLLKIDPLDNPYAVFLSDKEEMQKQFQKKAIRQMLREAERIDSYQSGRKNEKPNFPSEIDAWINTYGVLSNILRSEDTIISFNYDLFVDWAMSEPEWIIDYGTTFLELVPDMDLLCAGGPIRYYQRPNFGDNKIATILKLHGSLNWGICTSCNMMVAAVLTPIQKINRYIHKLQKESLDARRKYLCCPDFKLKPLMVPPTWMKDYKNRFLEDIWNVASRRLADATTITFLGYSFSESDFQVRYLFNRALHLRGGVPWGKVTVVDIDIKRIIGSYKRFFGKVEPFSGKASKYMKLLSEPPK